MRKVNPVGRPELSEQEKNKRVSLSLPFDVWKFLQSIENKSEYIAKLIRSKMVS